MNGIIQKASLSNHISVPINKQADTVIGIGRRGLEGFPIIAAGFGT